MLSKYAIILYHISSGIITQKGGTRMSIATLFTGIVGALSSPYAIAATTSMTVANTVMNGVELSQLHDIKQTTSSISTKVDTIEKIGVTTLKEMRQSAELLQSLSNDWETLKTAADEDAARQQQALQMQQPVGQLQLPVQAPVQQQPVAQPIQQPAPAPTQQEIPEWGKELFNGMNSIMSQLKANTPQAQPQIQNFVNSVPATGTTAAETPTTPAAETTTPTVIPDSAKEPSLAEIMETLLRQNSENNNAIKDMMAQQQKAMADLTAAVKGVKGEDPKAAPPANPGK